MNKKKAKRQIRRGLRQGASCCVSVSLIDTSASLMKYLVPLTMARRCVVIKVELLMVESRRRYVGDVISIRPPQVNSWIIVNPRLGLCFKEKSLHNFFFIITHLNCLGNSNNITRLMLLQPIIILKHKTFYLLMS